MINAPSLANCGLFTMAEEMDGMIRGGVNFVHIDIMDGHYVPNIFFPLSIVQAVRKRYPNHPTVGNESGGCYQSFAAYFSIGASCPIRGLCGAHDSRAGFCRTTFYA